MIQLMARWETRGKKYWLELWRNDFQGEEAYEIRHDHGYSNLGRNVISYPQALAIAEKQVKMSAYYDNINMKPAEQSSYHKNPAAEQILVTLLYSDKLNIFCYRRYVNNHIRQEATFTEAELKNKLKQASSALAGFYSGAINVALANPNTEVEVIRNYK